jgi:2-iminoacetate synthase ThiH
MKLWNKSINADFRGLLKCLGKAGIDGVLGTWEEVAKDTVETTIAIEFIKNS